MLLFIIPTIPISYIILYNPFFLVVKFIEVVWLIARWVETNIHQNTSALFFLTQANAFTYTFPVRGDWEWYVGLALCYPLRIPKKTPVSVTLFTLDSTLLSVYSTLTLSTLSE